MSRDVDFMASIPRCSRCNGKVIPDFIMVGLRKVKALRCLGCGHRGESFEVTFLGKDADIMREFALFCEEDGSRVPTEVAKVIRMLLDGKLADIS